MGLFNFGKKKYSFTEPDDWKKSASGDTITFSDPKDHHAFIQFMYFGNTRLDPEGKLDDWSEEIQEDQSHLKNYQEIEVTNFDLNNFKGSAYVSEGEYDNVILKNKQVILYNGKATCKFTMFSLKDNYDENNNILQTMLTSLTW
jgi:hypothetical protein